MSKTELVVNRNDIETLSNVRLFDRDETYELDLFCYVNCSNDDSDLLKACRGLVFHKDTLVMKTFSYTPEISHDETEKIQDIFNQDNLVFDSHEGCLIRVFYFKDKWFIATHKKLDAFQSKWSSRQSFGEIFQEALLSEESSNNEFKNSLSEAALAISETKTDGESEKDRVLRQFLRTLNRELQYVFLLRNTNENRTSF